MKQILLLVVMLAFIIGSSVARPGFGPGVNATDVEGVILNRQKASVKPGYRLERESVNAAAVIKTSNVARIQTGTITCVGQRGKSCELFFHGSQAQCSDGCYFVGTRGGVRAL